MKLMRMKLHYKKCTTSEQPIMGNFSTIEVGGVSDSVMKLYSYVHRISDTDTEYSCAAWRRKVVYNYSYTG
eukprot:SAG22_NODE_3089_length_1950_cov_1.398703_2_plen_71_part_00